VRIISAIPHWGRVVVRRAEFPHRGTLEGGGSSNRERTPSVQNAWDRWLFTVSRPMCRTVAISELA